MVRGNKDFCGKSIMFIEARDASLKKYVSLRKEDLLGLCIILGTFLA